MEKEQEKRRKEMEMEKEQQVKAQILRRQKELKQQEENMQNICLCGLALVVCYLLFCLWAAVIKRLEE